MNIENFESCQINWLFLDLNSFFASCEQQDRPDLRGRPVAVVQMLAETTFAIAASSEAKAFGVRTGTMVRDARQLCPNLVIVKARQGLYADYHRRVVAAVGHCLPVTKICSIDEMACRLMGRERAIDAAQALAHQVKQTIRAQVGTCMTCSVGLAPSLFLGKVASDMQKPDGLVTITRADLPHILYGLPLTGINGIGSRMEKRLNRAGIHTTAELLAAPRERLRRIWGGVTGVLFYELLHGADLQFPSSSRSSSMSHQHVLEPEFRTLDGAFQFARHLLSKAAERLRHRGYYTRRLTISVSPIDREGHFWNEIGFHETQDTVFLLARLAQLWQQAPRIKPIKVCVALLDLVPASLHQPDLFAQPTPRHALSPLIDRINRRYGRGAIAFGKPDAQIMRHKGHAAFQRVPETWEF